MYERVTAAAFCIRNEAQTVKRNEAYLSTNHHPVCQCYYCIISLRRLVKQVKLAGWLVAV